MEPRPSPSQSTGGEYGAAWLRRILRYSVAMEGIFSAWGRILTGYTPALSVEITRECPLRCPGCYAYGDDHLGGGDVTLRTIRDFKGQELIDGFTALVD